MCDTLCLLGDGVTLFAKNSDRPRSEPQIVGSFSRRPAGPGLRTQYLEIPDAGALSTILSRPTWLWGAEHGMNEHRVAIGNEMIFTADDPRRPPPGPHRHGPRPARSRTRIARPTRRSRP